MFQKRKEILYLPVQLVVWDFQLIGHLSGKCFLFLLRYVQTFIVNRPIPPFGELGVITIYLYSITHSILLIPLGTSGQWPETGPASCLSLASLALSGWLRLPLPPFLLSVTRPPSVVLLGSNAWRLWDGRWPSILMAWSIQRYLISELMLLVGVVRCSSAFQWC